MPSAGATQRPARAEDPCAYVRDDKERFLGITINPICGYSDVAMGFLLLAADITDRKLLESQLTQAQKLESIGQLAAGIAHELNTPIQYVGDNTRFLPGRLHRPTGPAPRLRRTRRRRPVRPRPRRTDRRSGGHRRKRRPRVSHG